MHVKAAHEGGAVRTFEQQAPDGTVESDGPIGAADPRNFELLLLPGGYISLARNRTTRALHRGGHRRPRRSSRRGNRLVHRTRRWRDRPAALPGTAVAPAGGDGIRRSRSL